MFEASRTKFWSIAVRGRTREAEVDAACNLGLDLGLGTFGRELDADRRAVVQARATHRSVHGRAQRAQSCRARVP
jgi:hypothetical protein